MSRIVVINSEIHLTSKRRSKIENKLQKKFPDDKILLLEPEFRIDRIISNE